MIKENHFFKGSGGVYVNQCETKDELEAYLLAKKKDIDFMQSPKIECIKELPCGNWEGRVKYYGLD